MIFWELDGLMEYYVFCRLNCNDLSTRGCIIWHIGFLTTWTISFMNLYIYQMFSPPHCGRANLRCETSRVSSLESNGLRSKWLCNTGLSFCKLIIDTWSKIDRIFVLNEFIPLWRVVKWLPNWNMITKKFLSWKSGFSSFDRWDSIINLWDVLL